jgi:hypothetical protein
MVAMWPCVQFKVCPLESRKVAIRITYGLLESRKLAISVYLSVGVNKISMQPQTPRFGHGEQQIATFSIRAQASQKLGQILVGRFIFERHNHQCFRY